MSRIRSVHPGFFTDENLVAASMSARLLFIGLGVEADDKGIFEWKPLTIKMRIFPADHVLVEELLAELVNVNAICRYEINGKAYGAIRNFRKFQKPKTPNDIHPATAEIMAFVGLVSETKEVKPAPFPPKGEKSFQMEEGGGNSTSVSNDTDGEPVVDPSKIMFDAGVSLIKSAGKSDSAARSWLGKARKVHGEAAVIAVIGTAKREGAIDPISFMEASLRTRARDRPRAAVPV